MPYKIILKYNILKMLYQRFKNNSENKATRIKLRNIEKSEVNEENFIPTLLLIVIQLGEKYMNELGTGKNTLYSVKPSYL